MVRGLRTDGEMAKEGRADKWRMDGWMAEVGNGGRLREFGTRESEIGCKEFSKTGK